MGHTAGGHQHESPVFQSLEIALESPGGPAAVPGAEKPTVTEFSLTINCD